MCVDLDSSFGIFKLWILNWLFFTLFFSQAVEQDGRWGAAPALQLWLIHKDRAVQSVLTGGHGQPPKSRGTFRRQWRLRQCHSQPLQRPWLSAHVHAGRTSRCSGERLPQALWRLLQHVAWRLGPNQVRVHAQLHPQTAVSGMRRHRFWLPLWRGLLRGLQSLLQKDHTR